MNRGLGTKTYISSGLFALYVVVIFLANWSINKWGIVPISFGLSAPAGVYFVELDFDT